MRTVVAWIVLGALLLGQAPALRAASGPVEYSEEARVARLEAVARAHRMDASAARHAANTQLYLGATMLIAAFLTPLFAEVRDEDFDALGSVLLGTIGLAVTVEGAYAEGRARELELDRDIRELEEILEERESAPPDESTAPQEPR
jgi:hypothetical protein